MPDDTEFPMFAREANPAKPTTDLRLRLHKFTLEMLDSEVIFRINKRDPDCSRSRIINEILANWAQIRWEAANFRIKHGFAAENPFEVEVKPLEFLEPQPEHLFEEVRTATPKATVEVIAAEAQHRKAFHGIQADRAMVAREILDLWANEEWHRTNIRAQHVKSNPHFLDWPGVAHG